MRRVMVAAFCCVLLGVSVFSPEERAGASESSPVLTPSYETNGSALVNTPPLYEPTPAPDAILDFRVTLVDSRTGKLLVEWKTSVPSIGGVEYENSSDGLTSVAHDHRGKEAVDTSHWVFIEDARLGVESILTILADGQRREARSVNISIASPELTASAPLAPRDEPTPSPDPVSNVVIQSGATGFLVKWKTSQPVTGWLRYGQSTDQLKEAYDPRGTDFVDTVHSVYVTGLKPLSNYIFYIVAGDKQYDNQGSPWEVKTLGSVWLPVITR